MTARIAFVVAALSCLVTRPAAAELAGGVNAGPTFGNDAAGGQVLVDLLPYGRDLRLGGAVGLGAVTSSDDDRSRLFAPIAVAMGVTLDGPALRLDLRARVGAWAGATNDGLRAGLYVGGHLGIGPRLSRTTALLIGVEFAGLALERPAAFVSPVLVLSWTAGGADDE